MSWKKNVSKLSKIQPVIDIVREQCLKVIPEESHSVDEQIVPAKTKYSGIRQYNPKKPVKWGFKNLVRTGSSGFMYDFYIYAGKDEIMKNSDFKHQQKSAQVVAQLCQHLPSHSGHQLFFDNWFTTLDLLIYLKNRGILACGTMRANRIQGCPLQTNKDMNKAGRGAIDFKSDVGSGIVVVKWLDNNAVHIASNYVGVEPLGAVERWSPAEKKRMSIQCPQVILRYNKGMGGVDLADMFISLYRINMKTRRWYIKIFWHLVDIAIDSKLKRSIITIKNSTDHLCLPRAIVVSIAIIEGHPKLKQIKPGRRKQKIWQSIWVDQRMCRLMSHVG